jgi:putative membrane protein
MPHLRRPGAIAAIAVAAYAATAAPVQAHSPARPDNAANLGVVVALLLLAAVAYGTGIVRLRPHARARRELARRCIAFAAGWLALAAALLSPLDALAATSFAAHMVQHEALMLIAAPLLVLGRGLPTMLWALPYDARISVARGTRASWVRRSWGVLTAPFMAWLLHATALWAWHAPPLFNAALASGGIHDLQHASFFVTALLFWHALLRHGAHAHRGAALLYLFTTTVHTGVLGALLTFAHAPLYAPFDAGLRAWGTLTPLEDQQLGGLIMWVPGALVYVGVALTLLARWLNESSPREATP